MTAPPLELSAAYVVRTCVPEHALAAAAGVSAATLEALQAAGVVPQPTYVLGPASVRSAIAALGPREGGRAYFGISVPPWLRLAAVLAERTPATELRAALTAWLAKDLAEALTEAREDAKRFGWSRMFRDDAVDRTAVATEAERLWPEWMGGGWAVCLRRFDGPHLVAKEVGRRRIAALTDECAKAELSPEARLEVLGAMARLDAVLLSFAPHERPNGTPGLILDATAQRYDLPWPACAYGDAQGWSHRAVERVA
ncbi:MAG: hypothetical protein JF588_06480 [Caulobacterales bacterium]|nr:hypothetical protein [Caulobacterales bacterium]